MAALQFCENLTRVNQTEINAKDKLGEFFSEREIVDLTACISIMNALNSIYHQGTLVQE